ncbi:allophanate hydrolase subunit 1 [Nonomuraea sp. NPDC049486]|uniref:5-oxoprolinase subunit B family protein n=1 Tax=unclassified Nonomuraea TaxID=2593643 RepID=UPI00341473D4
MIRRAGEHGLLVETGALEVSHRLDAALRAERPPEVLEVVPGPETVLVVAPGADQSRLRGLLETLLSHCHDVPSDDQSVRDDTTTTAPRTALDGTTERTTPTGHDTATPQTTPTGRDGTTERTTGRGTAEGTTPVPLDVVGAGGEPTVRSGAALGGAEVLTIPVVYDGADLESVAEAAGISVDEVVSRHAGRELVVGWLGFAPGFAYLIGLDPVLHVPRLATPRTSVPAGSVAIAGPYSAVYPSASPGGWRLLGRTDARVWDVSAEPPTPFRPGTRVRFEVA